MIRLLSNVSKHWVQRDGFGQAAALSFYALFSLTPILVFTLLVASHFLGEQSAYEATADWMDKFMSRGEVNALMTMIRPQQFAQIGWFMTGFSGIIFLWAASLFFVRLRISINVLQDNKASGVRQAVKRSLIGRLNALLFTIGAGLLFTSGVLFTALAPKLIHFAVHEGTVIEVAVAVMSRILLLFGIFATLKFLPSHRATMGPALIGSIFIVLAFELGRTLINTYVSHSTIASVYGAANALVVFLLWVFYSSQMVLFGVTITGVLRDMAEEK